MPRDVLFDAAGPLRPAYASVNWAQTAVGEPQTWTPALVGALDNALLSRFPVALFWGPDFVVLYNEAFVELIADKHPSALGAPAREVFPEAWDVIGLLMKGVLAGQGATWIQDAPVPLQRRGILEEAYFTFSYSPIRGAGGHVEGVMDIATETTTDVVNRRRLKLLHELHEQLAAATQIDDLAAGVLPILRTDPDDLASVELRLADRLSDETDLRPPDRSPTTRGDRALHVVQTPDGQMAWLELSAPESLRGRAGWLVVGLSEQIATDELYLGFLRTIAAAISQAIERLEARGIERRMSETLQRSLLTEPVKPNHLAVAVRYLPAAQEAQIGGDWYDCFLLPDGSLTLVMGDVAGHDRHAAAAMAQVRNLLRGIAYTVEKPPAEVLVALDNAMHDLAVDVYATVLLARVEQDEIHRAQNLRVLRWTNAGHPPPILIDPDGHARLLQGKPDPLLGLNLATRYDHTAVLEPGSTVVFYTDGLVERRDQPLDERLRWLTGCLHGRHELSAEALCDHIVEQLDDHPEDDIALLVLHAYDERGPHPPEAEAALLPSDLRADHPT